MAGYQNEGQREGTRIGLEYTAAIKEFLNGDIDKVFYVVAKEPFLHNHQGAKAMLAKAIKAQLEDAEAYRALVKLAADAGVPLVNPVTKLVQHETSTPIDEQGKAAWREREELILKSIVG